jgi:Transglutaminase-like superfamily
MNAIRLTMHAIDLKEIEVERWIGHSRMSDPADLASLIAELPSSVEALNRVVQGLLIHLDWLGAYSVSGDQLRSDARTTLPVADRLRDILAADPRPLSESRAPRRRFAGTCRDFALMTTSFLRCKGVPARLRCGFASYLGPGFEDHWVCEFWHRPSHAWRLSDAQIDEVMRSRLDIEFDPANVPRTSFLTAGEAWLAYRRGRSDPSRFGHGEATGVWFLRLNVLRDHFALNGAETSDWDDWRAAPSARRILSGADMDLADGLATEPEAEMTEVRPDWLEP